MNNKMICRRISVFTDNARIICVFVPLMISAAAVGQNPGGMKTEDITTANSAAPTNKMANPKRHGGTGGFGFGQPAPLPAGVKAERNIPYVENGSPNQVLDLFLPEQPSDKPLPLMIWIHGGAWMGGDQASPPVLYLVNKGFAVASVQHRFSSQAVWPAQAYDCKAAIRFLARERSQIQLRSGSLRSGRRFLRRTSRRIRRHQRRREGNGRRFG